MAEPPRRGSLKASFLLSLLLPPEKKRHEERDNHAQHQAGDHVENYDAGVAVEEF